MQDRALPRPRAALTSGGHGSARARSSVAARRAPQRGERLGERRDAARAARAPRRAGPRDPCATSAAASRGARVGVGRRAEHVARAGATWPTSSRISGSPSRASAAAATASTSASPVGLGRVDQLDAGLQDLALAAARRRAAMTAPS